MSNKVIHLSDEAHAKMLEYCGKYGLVASTWVGDLISEAVLPLFDVNGRLDEQRTKVVVKEMDIIRKKEKLESYDDQSNLEPWALPPFWENKNG